MGKSVKNLAILVFVFLITACARELGECNGPALNISMIKSIQNDTYGTGPKGYLVLDNPIDATGVGNISSGDSRILAAQKTYNIYDLLNPNALVSRDNIFIKINGYNDSNGLASPSGNGEYQFDFNDPKYWQVMSYYQIKKALTYVAALGFKLNRPKPLYAFTNASDAENPADTVNAFFEPNLFGGDPTIKFYNGTSDFKLLRDGDVPQHETGHYILYNITKSIGDADLATDYGAERTPLQGFHEGFADYVLETIENKPYIARWAARNFSEIAIGNPLRRAENSAGDVLTYNDVFESDGSIGFLDRYEVGKWVSRVLWSIRKEFLKEDKNAGNIFADRVVFTAASLLPKDASINDVKTALLKADGALHCGLHKRTIEKSFEDMGYKNIDTISSGLGVQYQVVGISYDNEGNAQITTPQAGGTLGFRLRITNSSGTRARDVRANLSSTDSRLHMASYMQAYGDLPAGKMVEVGNGLPINFSPTAEIDQGASGKIKFTLTVTLENGPPKVINGEFTL